MVDREIIKAKISHIQKSLNKLEEKKSVSLDEMRGNSDLQDIIIHNLQVSIQGCIDIASHIVSDQRWELPQSLAGLFDVLLQHKILDPKLADKMKSMVGFRNIIVHEYQEIDLAKVHDILVNHLNDIYAYLQKITTFAKI